MNYKRPNYVLFDFGHTLIHETGIDEVAGYQALLDNVTENPDGITAPELMKLDKELYSGFRKYVPDAEYEIVYSQTMRGLLDVCGLKSDKTYEELEAIMWDASIPSQEMPGAGKMLDSLHSMGINTGVISNLPYSEFALRHRITSKIPNADMMFYIASSSYGVRKPNQILFDVAKRWINRNPDEIWFCGDNSRADVLGSHMAGMVPVWYKPPIPCFYRPKDLDEAVITFDHLEISHWDELVNLIELADK